MSLPLKIITHAYRENLIKNFKPFRYHDKIFVLIVSRFGSPFNSPFMDKTSAGDEFLLYNLTDGKTIVWSGLIPIMIERYGFYEGETPYRVPPEMIAETFPWILKK